MATYQIIIVLFIGVLIVIAISYQIFNYLNGKTDFADSIETIIKDNIKLRESEKKQRESEKKQCADSITYRKLHKLLSDYLTIISDMPKLEFSIYQTDDGKKYHFRLFADGLYIADRSKNFDSLLEIGDYLKVIFPQRSFTILSTGGNTITVFPKIKLEEK